MATPRICSVQDCGNQTSVNGLCNAHYRRWRDSGDVQADQPVQKRGDASRWLLRHADTTTEDCIIWPFGRISSGYGMTTVSGHRVLAHRRMCELAHGETPTPLHQAAHSCGNGRLGCVNPKHLRWATASENETDKVQQGRSNRGVRSANAKLTEEDVRWIRSKRGVMTQEAIAQRLYITKTNVSHIWRRKSWAWLDQESTSE